MWASTRYAVRAKGYVFIFEKGKNQFYKVLELRDRIVSLTDAALVINILPNAANLEKANYRMNKEARLVVTDGENFSLDINEFGVFH